MIKAVMFICLAVLLSNACLAREGDGSPPVIAWGESVGNVRLSIALTTNTVSHGSIEIKAMIENASTNKIGLMEYLGITDFDVVLANISGKMFKLNPPKPLAGSRVPIFMVPGEVHKWVVSVDISSDLEPGAYVLKISRNFKMNNKWFKVDSNTLNVQIK